MIIDTSAIVALIQDEQPATTQVSAALAGDGSPSCRHRRSPNA